MTASLREKRILLERYFEEVSKIILSRQHGASGLIPASVAVTAHGDYRDAWVRDNVYSILAVWGLGLAYRRLDDDQGHAYMLEHATIKCMRGLLFAMMRQANKVENFKKTQALAHSLHAKYNTATGATVVGDSEWGHLQIDATTQMTVSGLHIIYTLDEVDFVQNLVFYIERAYRTPDYGIWERGNKINHGQPELNCSSIGMVVAALQAINGINLFGSRGGPASVIHSLPDEIVRNHTTLHSALPRESASKEIDAALLAVISFPAFAVTDPALIDKTRTQIIEKLGGKYGCKRFLRDGHQTVLEDHNRLHYDAHELTIFENIESEWPLFFTYLILDGIFNENKEQTKRYQEMLKPLLVESVYGSDNRLELIKLVPELYLVPKESIEAEKKNPGSQKRVPNENIPLVWAQSLYILGQLINDDLLSPADVDPLGLRMKARHGRLQDDTVVQVILVSESVELQTKLLMYGLETQTVENCEPIKISEPSSLRDAFSYLGSNQKLGLSGRPDRPMGTLSTCKIYRCQGRLYAYSPHYMNREEFYMVSDNDYLVSLFEQEVAFVKNHWMQIGRPTMIVKLNKQMVGNLEAESMNTTDSGKRNLLNYLISMKSSGICNGTRVRVGRLSEMINTACIESLDFLVSHVESELDWDSILTGSSPKNDNATKLQPCGDGLKKRSSIHRFVKYPDGDSAEKSPLTKALGESPEHEEFTLLKDKEITEVPGDVPLLSVVFGDPSHANEAIALLKSTTTLLDQVDLLHYLHSCFGGKYVIPEFASIDVLLEEVYQKAMQTKQWSIIRTAAGILRKNVNSLTSNLADLLIRQKVVSVGFQASEYYISTPQTPDMLSKIIYEHCSLDVREGPVIQELFTYLGSMIRSTPNLFSGIMRIRTHFFLVAMREEISRGSHCDEEDALEHLFKLSPYEMKYLLNQVLIAHEQVDSFELSLAHINLTKGQNNEETTRVRRLSKVPSVNSLGNELTISCQSAGFFAGNFANIEIKRDGVPVRVPMVPGRGLNLVAIDPYDGQILESLNFDVHYSKREGEHMAQHMAALATGTVVVLVAKDDFVESMSESAYVAIERIGSTLIRKVQYRDSYCIIGQIGAAAGSALESHTTTAQGPTETLSYKIDLRKPESLIARKGSLFAASLPSNGWWIRRRRNDGALSRMPPNFYPKVWQILSKTDFIRVGDYRLNAIPTINESTPGELNFAIQVEKLLNNIVDPAELQIAVECLVVISRIDERNPELILTKYGFDLLYLIKETIAAFWTVWVKENASTGETSPIKEPPAVLQKAIESASISPVSVAHPIKIVHTQNEAKPDKSLDRIAEHVREHSPPDFSFAKNEKVARRIFYDLRQDGLNGTMSYLAATCVKNVFEVAFQAK